MIQVSVLCNEPKFWQLTIVLQAIFRNNLISTTPIGQIIPCHVTEVKMLLFFGLLHHDSIGL